MKNDKELPSEVYTKYTMEDDSVYEVYYKWSYGIESDDLEEKKIE